MAGATIRISVDREFMKAWSLLADQKDTTIGAMALEAIADRFGNDIQERRSFFKPDVAQKPHTAQSENTPKRSRKPAKAAIDA